jgi:hypothetical protein
MSSTTSFFTSSQLAPAGRSAMRSRTACTTFAPSTPVMTNARAFSSGSSPAKTSRETTGFDWMKSAASSCGVGPKRRSGMGRRLL